MLAHVTHTEHAPRPEWVSASQACTANSRICLSGPVCAETRGGSPYRVNVQGGDVSGEGGGGVHCPVLGYQQTQKDKEEQEQANTVNEGGSERDRVTQELNNSAAAVVTVKGPLLPISAFIEESHDQMLLILPFFSSSRLSNMVAASSSAKSLEIPTFTVLSPKPIPRLPSPNQSLLNEAGVFRLRLRAVCAGFPCVSASI